MHLLSNSVLISVATTAAFTVVSVAANGGSSKTAASQMASFAPGDGKCQGDVAMYVRNSLMMDQCLEKLNNTLKASETNSLCNTQQSETPIGLSCVYDIMNVPSNSRNNPYVIAEVFSGADCQGTLLGLTGMQIDTIMNVTLNGVPDTIIKTACQKGGQVQKLQCTNSAGTDCKPYETVKEGQCAAIPNDGSTSTLPSARSVKYRCLSSADSGTAASFKAAIASLLLAPFLASILVM